MIFSSVKHVYAKQKMIDLLEFTAKTCVIKIIENNVLEFNSFMFV